MNVSFPLTDTVPTTAGPSVDALPVGLVLAERASLALRAALRARGLDDYVVFHADSFDLQDIDLHLPRLDPGAAWEALPLLGDGWQPHALEGDGDGARRLEPAGVVHLPGHRVALARWHYWNLRLNHRQTLVLAAAPSVEVWGRFRSAVRALRRAGGPVWTIFHDVCWQDRKPRQAVDWSDLLFSDDVTARLRAEALNFFSPAVAGLYAKLGVPYRRGLLLHGPPGNGKTSIVRALGWSLPEVPGIILRPAGGFDSGDLAAVFRRWVEHAPAMLVIEDLDHLLEEVDLSQFLNLVDGIEGSSTGGLLLIASTNNPQELDPAITNRPGRFDVVMEVAPPAEGLRERFFRGRLGELDPATLAHVVRESAGLSFCHLHEIVRLSGLMAAHDGRDARTPADVRAASALVARSDAAARRGFPRPAEGPFGLEQFRRKA